jgi:phage terminase small subunit
MPEPDSTSLVNTERQHTFVRAVVEGMSYRQAATEVGYSASYGPQLAEKDHIQRAIAELRREAREESIVTASDVAEGLLKEARYGHDAEEGASHSARVRAWELLGEHLGLFDETRADDDVDQVNIYQQINQKLESNEDR